MNVMPARLPPWRNLNWKEMHSKFRQTKLEATILFPIAIKPFSYRD